MLIIKLICMINFKGQLEQLFMKISTYISRKIDGKKIMNEKLLELEQCNFIYIGSIYVTPARGEQYLIMPT